MSEFFSWRSAFQKSRLPSTTKLVLFCISTYMNDHGDGAFPSIKTLMQDASLSNRAIIDHTQIAVDAGFLKVDMHGFSGRGWRRNEYRICYPESGSGPDEVVNEVHYPTDDKVVNLTTEGGEPHDVKVVNDVHTITPVNSPENTPLRARGEISEKEYLEQVMVAAEIDLAKCLNPRTHTDATRIVAEWRTSGVDVASCAVPAIETIVTRKRLAGKSPPCSLKYYRAAVLEAHAKANPNANYGKGEQDQWRTRVGIWLSSGKWMGQWGGAPDQVGTYVPGHILAEMGVAR
ncbi:MAG: hypothetical protein COB49_00560 [Alphaproteobacteria bacterium]|nr:MAG: hypothetical protein COB49_00560 [Alphaproteobacteria bacterium]